jgi:esterase/lipase superfamily enzyme
MTRTAELTAPASGFRGQVVSYGHWGSPVLVFPSEAGRAWDFENNGMVDAVRFLLDAGRLKLY